MKKWSFEKKKRFVYIVTALLISAIVIVVIANLGILNASATDIEDYPFEYYPLNEYDYYKEYSSSDVTMTSNESGDMVTYTFSEYLKRIVEFSSDIRSTTYYMFVIAGNIIPYNETKHNVNIQRYINNATTPTNILNEVQYINNLPDKPYKYIVIQGITSLSSSTETLCKFDIITGGKVSINGTYEDTYPLDLYGVILTTNYQYGALRAQFFCDQENEIDIWTEQETETETENTTPLTEVYGTDQFTISSYDKYNTYTIENIVPTSWNDFYAGFIGRVKTADGISVPIYYNWGVDGLQYGDGTITVLDPNYHEYIQEITINGTITNGNMQLDTSTDIEIVYIAISGNHNNLSNHLLQKVNEYQLVANQIQEAYNNGYQNGYTDGVNITQMGAFGDAELIVYFNFVEDATGTYFKQQVNFPFNVNTGGISFDNVWTWYMNSEWNRSGISVYNVEFDIILYDTGVLWSNTMFRFGVAGYEITAQMLPYSVQVSTVEVLENVWDDVNLTNSGKYYYLTNDSLIGYHVDRIRFYINAQDLSYYDQLITNKLTLYNNLGEYTMNVKSFNAGYNNGYDVGYINGEKDGIIQAQELAYNKGHADGYEEGIDAGYVIGFDEGVGQDFRFYDLFFSMFDAQLNTFRSVVSFEIFGINVAGFILGLITIAIAAFVLKKVW